MEIAKEALKNGELKTAEKVLHSAIKKEILESADSKINVESYRYLAEVIQEKATQDDLELPTKQRYLLQAAALLNFVKNLMRNGDTENELSKKMLTTVSQKLQEIQDNLVLSVGGNLPCYKFNSESYKKSLDSLRNVASSRLNAIHDRYVSERDSEEDHREMYVEQAEEIRVLFKTIASEMKLLFSDIIKDCMAVIGKPPCNYEIIVLGSLAREEMTPYSDLEWAILTSSEEERCKTFFRNLTNLVHLQVINLGETILPSMDIKALTGGWFYDEVTPRGVSFDGFLPQACKTPLGNVTDFELIHNPTSMAAFQNKNWRERNPGLGEILQTVAPLKDNGNHQLLNEYRQDLRQFLHGSCDSNECDHDSSDSKCPTRNECRGLKTVKQDVFKYSRFYLNTERQNDGKLYDVKQEIYRVTDRVIVGLGKCVGIEKNGAFDILDELREKGKIEANARDNLASAVAIALKLRLATYLKAGKQAEDVKSIPTDETCPQVAAHVYRLPNKTELFHFYYVVVPLCEEMKIFCNKGAEHSVWFSEKEFFEYSDVIKANIYSRILDYPKAHGCYERALEKDPRNMELKFCCLSLELITKDNKDGGLLLKRKLVALLQQLGKTYNFPEVNRVDNNEGVSEIDYCRNFADTNLPLASIPPLIHILSMLSSVHETQGDFKTAQLLLQQCAKLQNLLGLDSSDVHVLRIRLEILGLACTCWTQSAADDLESVISTLTIFIKREGINIRAFLLLTKLGSVLETRSKYNEAYQCLQRAFSMGRLLYGVNLNFYVVHTLLMLGNVCEKLALYEEGKMYLKQSRPFLLSLKGRLSVVLIRSINVTLANICNKSSHPEEAITYVTESLALTPSVTTASWTDIMIDCQMYCEAASAWHDLGAEEKAWRAALSARDSLLRVTNLGTRMVLRGSIATTYVKLGKNKEAVELMKQGVNELPLDFDDLVIVQCLNVFGGLLRKQGSLKEAKDCYQRALEMKEVKDVDSFDVINSLLGIANVHLENGELSEAMNFADQSWKAVLTMEPSHDKCRFLGEVAACWRTLVKPCKAKMCLEQALEIYKRSVVSQKMPNVEYDFHVRLADLVEAIATVGDDNGARLTEEQVRTAKRFHYSQAAELLRRHLESGNFNSWTVALFASLAEKFRAIGDISEEEKLLVEGLRMSEEVYDYGAVNEMFALILSRLSNVCLETANYEKALEYLVRSLKMELKIHSSNPHHAHILSGMFSLAVIYRKYPAISDPVNDLENSPGHTTEDGPCDDEIEKATCFAAKASLHFCFGDFEGVEKFSRMASDIYRRLGDHTVCYKSMKLVRERCELMLKLAQLAKQNPNEMLNSSGWLQTVFRNIRTKGSTLLTFAIVPVFQSTGDGTVTDINQSGDLTITNTSDGGNDDTPRPLAQAYPYLSSLVNQESEKTTPTHDYRDDKLTSIGVPITSFEDNMPEGATARDELILDDDNDEIVFPETGEVLAVSDLGRFLELLGLADESKSTSEVDNDGIQTLRNLDDSDTLLMSDYANFLNDPVQEFLNNAFMAKENNEMALMSTYLNMAAKYKSSPRQEALISKLLGQCNVALHKYKLAAIDFGKAAAFYRSLNLAADTDDLCEFMDSLRGLTESHLLCNDVESAWCTCEEALSLKSVVMSGTPTFYHLISMYYLAAKCSTALIARGLTHEHDMQTVVSFCKEALSASEEAELVVGSNDANQELNGSCAREDLFPLKCEVTLLLARTLSEFNLEEEARSILVEMVQRLRNLAAVFEAFSSDTWPEGDKKFWNLQINLFSWIGQALLLLGEVDDATDGLKKSLAALFVLQSMDVKLYVENLLSLLDAITARNIVETNSFQQTLEFCKRLYMEQHDSLEKLVELFADVGNLYVDRGRTQEAVSAFEIGLAVAESMHGGEVQKSCELLLLYLGMTHALQATLNVAKSEREELLLAEKYFRMGQELEDRGVTMDLLYAQFLIAQERFDEAIPLLERVIQLDDCLWDDHIAVPYYQRRLYGPSVCKYVELHGELLTFSRNLGYSFLVRAYVDRGMRKQAVRFCEEFAVNGRDEENSYENRPLAVSFLLGCTQRSLLSLVDGQIHLQLVESDVPLTAENLTELYYALEEYDLALRYSNKARELLVLLPKEDVDSVEYDHRHLWLLRTGGNSLIMLERVNEAYSYFATFLMLLQSQVNVLEKPFEEAQAILRHYSFAHEFCVYRALGMLLVRRGNIDGALKVYEHCIDVDKEYSLDPSLVGTLSELYQTKAFTTAKNDKVEHKAWMMKAQECFEAFFRSNKKPTPFLEAAFASFLYRIQRTEEAVHHFQNSITDGSADEVTISFSHEDKCLLSTHLQQEIEVTGQIFLPNKVYVLYQMVSAYFKLGKTDELQVTVKRMEEYVASKRTSPLFPLCLAVLGYAYKETGNESKAAEAFNVVLQLMPGHRPVKNALESCKLYEEKELLTDQAL